MGNPEHGASGTILVVLNGAKSKLLFQWVHVSFHTLNELEFYFYFFYDKYPPRVRGHFSDYR